MVDLNLLRERFEELTTVELLRDVYLQGEDFEEEAIAVIREVLEARSGGLQKLYSEELEESGEEVGRVEGITDFWPRIKQRGAVRPGDKLVPASGHLLLTTTGLGFHALEAQKTVASLAGYLAGPVGVAVGGFMDKEDAKPAGERGLNLPISLLSQIDLLSVWYPVEDLERIELDNKVISIMGEPEATARFPDEGKEALFAWGKQVEVPVEDVTGQKKGFFKRLFGR